MCLLPTSGLHDRETLVMHRKEPRALLVPARLPVPPAPRAAPLSFRPIQRMIPALPGETQTLRDASG